MEELDEQLEGQVYINGNLVIDNRTKVGIDIQQQPYNSLAFLKCQGEITEDVIQYGTVFIIAEKYAITTAHLLFNKTKTKEKIIKPYKNMVIYPKANGEIMIPTQKNKQQVQPIKIIDFRVHSKIKDALLNNNTSLDVAIVKLQKPVLQSKFIKLAIQSTPNDLVGKTVVNAGYPCDKFSRGKNLGTIVECYYGNGQIVKVQEQYNSFQHNIPTQKGQSGSPIFLYINGKILAIGLHKSYKKSKKINCGLLFSSSILKTIYDWIWDMQTPIFNIYQLQNKGQIFKLSSTDQRKQKHQLTKQKLIINWIISEHHKNFFQIDGPNLTKSVQNKIFSCIYSHQHFPLNSVSYCHLQIKEVVGSVFIGITNKRPLNHRQKSSLQLDQNTCLLSTQIKNIGLNKLAFNYKKYNKQMKIQNHNFNNNIKHTIMIEVDYFKQQFKIYYKNQKKISLEINQTIIKQKIFLIIALLNKKDSIKLISNNTSQF